MIDAATVERMLALAVIKPFGALKESELLLIAQQTIERSFAPGEVIMLEGQLAEVMVVPVAGSAVSGDEPFSNIIGAASILFGLPMQDNVMAGPDGTKALCLAKPHLFTIARECPDFIVGLAALEDLGAL